MNTIRGQTVLLRTEDIVNRLRKLSLTRPEIDKPRAEAALARAIASMGLLPLLPIWKDNPDKCEPDELLSSTFSMFPAWEPIPEWRAAWSIFYPDPQPVYHFATTSAFSELEMLQNQQRMQQFLGTTSTSLFGGPLNFLTTGPTRWR